MSAKYAHYIQQPEDRLLAKVVMQHLHEATPGGLRREQFMGPQHPLKVVLEMAPWVLLLFLSIFAIATRK